MGTRQGSVSPEHVQAYFDEWVFRPNRRNARSRGLLVHTLLRQAVKGQPVTYRSLLKAGRTGRHRNRHAEHGSYRAASTRAARTALAYLSSCAGRSSLGLPRWRPPFAEERENGVVDRG